ncbi:type I-G CRISPR-associated helicase/endonuclease Cas3g [Tessaracoccus caeni]|uniref:type I-G CRISPR-associated helicase/endonuclease Cas3g n=1 Tax=Tessaracoccus caeni TaxID=3031239 RepID=UPI0023D97ED8|nr:hypothetical protein [Tessaracoccus caeni]MDF1489858.1 hypothetical protein [Tessaracoccus caeni]
MTTPFPPFPDFFLAATGHVPHRWQSELARRMQDDDIPSRVEIPTGLGKTATILIAIYHLASQLHHGRPRTAPQRIFHVVNRRTLVHDTHGLVGKFAETINGGVDHPVIGPIRAALCHLLGPGDDIPIVVGSIHGESARDTAWLRATGCSIVTLTPHQYVSRLLMRAFAVSPSRRPIDAGLVGVDRLVLFDEPHLATPAVQTILDAERLQARAAEALGIPLGHTVLMGATLPPTAVDGLDNGSVLTLGVDNLGGSETSAERLFRAPKRLHLERTKSGSDIDTARAMVTRATSLAADDRSVVVFANTVGLAQDVYRLLQKNHRWADQTQLITSRFRRFDRTQEADLTAITVTTQCLEVGVDLSFDALVTEAASWSALVQRLGRLNRRAEPQTAEAYLIMAATGSVRSGTKAVYGEDAVLGAVELLEQAESEQPGGIDVSPAALSELGWQHEDQRLDRQIPRAATLHAGLLPLMTHTRPSPSPDLPVEAFVTGPDRPVNREIEVAWRAQVDGLAEAKIGAVAAEEIVSIPRSALARLLRGEAPSDKEPISDLPDLAADEVSSQRPAALDLRELKVWSGRNERAWTPRSIRQVLAAERVTLPCSAGGYDPDLGWTGAPGSVEDIHLTLALQGLQKGYARWRRIRLSMCLSASLFTQACDHLEGQGAHREGIDDLLVALADADEDSLDFVLDRITTTLGTALQRFVLDLVPSGTEVTVLVDRPIGLDGPPDLRAVMCTVTVATTGYNVPASLISLDAHQEQVGSWAETDGRAAGLREDLAADVGVAGRFHDIGKAYPPFQRYLAGTSSAEVTAEDLRMPSGIRLPLLAKPLANVSEDSNSLRNDDWIARAASSLPRGFRHEAKSIEVARQHRLSKLAIHLIGSHHGLCRPLMPPLQATHLEGYSHADDFAELNARFGPWGLAYLEAVLRLADWRASASPIQEAQSIALPSKSTLSSLDPDFWERPDELSSRREGGIEHALPGLVTHPLTGWLASVGLLAAAVDLGDEGAALRWAVHGSAPQFPILKSALPLRDLVEHALDRERWAVGDELVSKTLLVKGASLRRKNQKLKPADRLRSVLRCAEVDSTASLVLGLIGDASRADAGNQVELPIVPFANNSSYPGVALAFTERREAVDECLSALQDINSGYSATACDGGLDRPRGAAPLVNGLGAPGDERMVKTALAPLALYAMARLGNTGAGALGVSRSGRRLLLVLPIPTTSVSFEMLRSMTIGVRSPSSWAWSEIGAEWVYCASREYLSDRKDVDIVWSGRIIPRAELKEIQRHGINRP